jgi:hypothetical protein
MLVAILFNMETLESLDPTTIQNLLGNNQPSLIPESLITTITVGFIVLNVLGALFLIAYIFGIIRKWKVQSAVLHMQKDLAEIKARLPESAAAPQSVPNTSQDSSSA